MYRVIWKEKASKQLAKIDRVMAKKIKDKVKEYLALRSSQSQWASSVGILGAISLSFQWLSSYLWDKRKWISDFSLNQQEAPYPQILTVEN